MHRFSRWKIPLSQAQSVSEVITLIGDYLKAIPAADIESLPASCRDALTESEIPGSAVVLIREELRYAGGDPAVAEKLHEIAHTFVAASNRIASIQARGQTATPLTDD